jgi:hypothetical protein
MCIPAPSTGSSCLWTNRWHHIAFDVKETLDAQQAADAFLAKHLK